MSLRRCQLELNRHLVAEAYNSGYLYLDAVNARMAGERLYRSAFGINISKSHPKSPEFGYSAQPRCPNQEGVTGLRRVRRYSEIPRHRQVSAIGKRNQCLALRLASQGKDKRRRGEYRNGHSLASLALIFNRN